MDSKRFILTLSLIATFLLGIPLKAQKPLVRTLEIEAILHQDGSATLIENWDIEFWENSEYTEYYMPISNLKNMTISNLHVSETNLDYVYEGENWDIDRTIEQKKGRCGIVRKSSDAVEICWGIGSLERHSWIVSYDLTGFVQSLQDYDAFIFQFVNSGLQSPPEMVSLSIKNDFGAEWSTDNTRVWGFGTQGEISVTDDGRVSAFVGLPMQQENYLTLMVRFDKGMFSPAVSRDIPFEKMQKKAFRGSDYSSGGFGAEDVILLLFLLLLFLPSVFGIIYVIIELIRGRKYRKSLFGERKITGWFRDTPLDGDLLSAAYVLKHGNRFGGTVNVSNLIGAFFLRWIMNSIVTLQPDSRNAKRVNLVFTHEPSDEDEVYSGFGEAEKKLYKMAWRASGDRVLEKNEFKEWSRKNYELVLGWPAIANSEGYANLVDKKMLTTVKNATEEARPKLRNVIEFKNFLNDFTLSKERGAVEVGLWKDYLVYAQLFGIASKVSSQFKKLYPEEFAELSKELGVNSNEFLWYVNYNNVLSNTIYQQAAVKAGKMSSSEIGGFGGGMSIGGGGGFSGGGFGGGAR